MTNPSAKSFLKVIIVSFTLFILTLGANAKTTPQAMPVGDAMARQQAQNALQNIALPFIENRGQIDPAVAYYVKASQGAVFLTRNGELVFKITTI